MSTSHRDFDREIEDAIRAAQRAAGFEFLGTLTRLCLLPALGSVNETDNVPPYVRDPNLAPPRETWYADAAQVFDNLYFVGGKLHSAWALKTSQGFILLDTIYPYNSEELIVGGMQRLGLDPNEIKYVVISHAHGDHIGGAEMLQKRGARIVMDPVDWDMLSRYPNRYTSMAPRRDIDAYDGMPLTLGDTTVTLWRTPGHTPGTLSFTFGVLDRGRPLTVVYSGGTALNFPCSTPDPGIRNLQIYIDSQQRIASQAAAVGATVLLSNHSEFDNAVGKIKMLAGRGDGPHPFEVGSELVQRYFEVTRNGARAAQIRLERLAAPD
ncbi:MAG: MBL fold metallo-hydrolase [Chloroflexi bacterium]|nr:MBL fold metallo-hydrolase [Chloroflexota bacterium]MBV9894157.1 MBL fold metallo-hydrolase [Chloroflexota bacterium]